MLNSFPQSPLLGIMVDPGYRFVLGLLAALKAGNGFVPMDPQAPIERLRFIQDECGIQILITESKYLEKVQQISALKHLIVLDQAAPDCSYSSSLDICWWTTVYQQIPTEKHIEIYDLDRVVYVIYTSGTTGEPKGVPITHRNLGPLMLWQRDNFKLGKNTRTLQTLSTSFDFGIQEILTTILFGGTLFFASRETIASSADYVKFIDANLISMIYATPSYIKTALTSKNLSSLKVILLGGEILKEDVLQDISNVVEEDCLIFNGYGPTEASINATMFKVNLKSTHYPGSSSVPIGTVSANNRVYLLDANFEPVPVGVAGEVFIGGPGVAFGYLLRPELTAQKFLPDQFSNDVEGRLYRTGDLARYLADGVIEFLGRLDDQVKIRGFRVEPSEVEAVMCKHSDVAEAVVVPCDDGVGDKFLAGYFVLRQSKLLAKSALRQFILEKLPSYMVPTVFLQVDSLPLTPNGKVDRQALPHVASTPSERDASMTKSTTELEKIIVAEWQKALHIDEIGVNENFFELGGHSLMVGRVHTRLVEIIGRDFPASKMFQYPKTSDLVNYLENSEEAKPSSQESNLRAQNQRRAIASRLKMRQELRKKEPRND